MVGLKELNGDKNAANDGGEEAQIRQEHGPVHAHYVLGQQVHDEGVDHEHQKRIMPEMASEARMEVVVRDVALRIAEMLVVVVPGARPDQV